MHRKRRTLPVVSAAVCAALLSTANSQQSVAAFDAATLVVDFRSRIDVALDLDRDGDVDGAGIWVDHRPTQAWVWLQYNDGTGRFTRSAKLDQITIPENDPDVVGITTGDWNGDGWDDLLVWDTDELRTYTNTGGTPTMSAPIPLVGAGRFGEVGDLDGDGHDDFAVSVVGGVEVRFGPAFDDAVRWTGAPIQAVRCAEVTGDANADVVVSTGTSFKTLRIDNGALVEVSSYAHAPIGSIIGLVAGDCDGDGDGDIVAFGSTQYVTCERTGPESFAIAAPVHGGPATGLADIDGDGDLDGVCCGGGGVTGILNDATATYHISINQGRGRFAPAYTIHNIGARQLAGAVDIDGDGDVDLLAGRGVVFNRGTFGRAPQPVVDPLDSDSRRHVDIDRDGDVDLLGDLDDWLMSNGDGTFSREAARLPWPPHGTSYVGPGFIGDFDGDGDDDLIVGQEGVGGPLIGMRLLSNTGGGYFTDSGLAGPFGQQFQPGPTKRGRYGDQRALIQDLDGDGHLDIAAHWTERFPSAFKLWWNDGSGKFTEGVGANHYAIAGAGQFNADDFPDLVVLQELAVEWGDLKLAFSRDGRSFDFGGATELGSGHPAFEFPAVADVDADGDPDVLGIVSGGSLAVWHADRSTGTLSRSWAGPTPAPLRYATGTPTRYFFADVDGNGKLDAIAGPVRFAEPAYLIAYQDQAGEFSSQTVQMIDPRGIVDIDGDGDVDALGTRLVNGLRWHGASAGSRRQYGASFTGKRGMAPTLGATGPFRAGHLATSRITGGVGGAFGIFFLGTMESAVTDYPLAGLTTYAWPMAAILPFTLGGEAGVDGVGSIALPYVVPPGLGDIYAQAMLLDAEAPLGVSHTGGLHLSFGN